MQSGGTPTAMIIYTQWVLSDVQSTFGGGLKDLIVNCVLTLKILRLTQAQLGAEGRLELQ